MKKQTGWTLVAAVALLAAIIGITRMQSVRTAPEPDYSRRPSGPVQAAARQRAEDEPAQESTPDYAAADASPQAAPTAITVSADSPFSAIDTSRIADQKLRNRSNGWKERELLVRSEGKYPLQRVVETLRPLEEPGLYAIDSRVAMVADEVIVKLADGASETDLNELAARYGITVARKLALPGHYVLQLKAPRLGAVPEAIDVFAGEPAVLERTEPNHLYSTAAVPNDSDWGELWGMRKIQATNAWEETTGSDSVLVAVVDTGMDASHEDLLANRWINPGETGIDDTGLNKQTNGLDDDGNGYVDDWQGWDFYDDDNDPSDGAQHGTHVSGTIGAVGNNAQGVAGVCWDVSLVGIRFLGGSDDTGSTADAVDAILYASSLGAEIQNHSWGGYGSDETLEAAIQSVHSNGVLFVAAAGNFNNNNDDTPFYPASYDVPNVISVAATDENDLLASFSHYGAASVDLAAPGVDIYSTVPGDSYDSFQGTSMAAPHVAGAAALLLSANAGLTHLDIKDALINSTDKLPSLTGRVVSDGRLNVATLMRAAADADADGMPDDWEDENGLNKNNSADASVDNDGDHLTNLNEYLNGTNPFDSDTDDDSLVDGWEVTYGFSPLSTTGQLDSVTRNGISTLDEAMDVVVTNGIAYVADGDEGLVLIDVSNPVNPTRIGSVDTDGFAGGVDVSGTTAYIGDGTNGLVVIDVSIPSAPIITGSYNTTGTAARVAARSNYVYVADGAGAMPVIDVSDPYHPSQAGLYHVAEQTANDIYINGGFLYLVTDNSSINKLSLANPVVPVWKDGIGFGPNINISAIHGNETYLFAAAGDGTFKIVDTAMNRIGDVDGYKTREIAEDIFVSGNYLYLAEGVGGLEIFDISTITAPVRIDYFETYGGGNAVFADGNYVYFADGASGLQIFYISFDADADGMLDTWEQQIVDADPLDAITNIVDVLPGDDFDGDGIINWGEYLADLNPTNSDQDADGLIDGTDEVQIYNTDPRTPDTDSDDLDDGDEINGTYGYVTDPLDPDTDGDGLGDGWEVDNGFDPLDPSDASGDADGDGLTNLEEYNAGTDPNDPDTDNDGMPDGWEVDNGLDPLTDDSALDPDSDGLTNLDEYTYGTDPQDSDSDDDSMPDGWEVDNGFDPLDPSDASGDADGDGLTNLGEYYSATDPNNPDTDGDGLPDGWEVTNGLLPVSTNGNHGAFGDPDADSLFNIHEYSLTSTTLWQTVYTSVTGAPASFWFSTNGVPGTTDPKDSDSDNDGLNDYYEITTNAAITNLYITNPNDADTDGDGLPDKWELDQTPPGDPTTPALPGDDSDGDGITNADEDLLGTDKANATDPVVVDDNGPNDPWPGFPLAGDPNENGTLAHPFDSIQEAVNSSNTMTGVTVLVMPGTYRGPGNYDISPNGKGITIRSWNNRDGTVINSGGSGSAFLINSGETTNTVIRDLSLTTTLNCCSDGDCDQEEAIVIDGASPLITGCKIYECELAAIICSDGAAPVIENCEITDTKWGIYATDSSPSIISNRIDSIGNGLAGESGIGIRVSGSSGLIVRSTIVSNCIGRGLHVINDPAAKIIDSSFINNYGGMTLENSGSLVDRCVVRGNQAPTYYSDTEGNWVLTNLFDLDGDGTDTTDSDENGGGILLLNGSSPMIRNCLIVENRTWADDPNPTYNVHNELIQACGLGGGVYIGTECNPTGVNCTIANNHANTRGGGISSSGNPFLLNLISWSNTANDALIEEGARTNRYQYPNIHCRSGNIQIWYSDIQYGYSGANASTTADPLFVGGGDYHLSSTNSPAFNSGIYYLAPTNDLDENPRPSNLPIDMGCYEFVDSDGDGIPDSWEIDQFGDLSNTGAGDADSDGATNLQEYLNNTNPNNPDTDGDGLNDGDELTLGTDPTDSDSDDDGLSDGDENAAGTDPLDGDSDDDGMPDGWESASSLNPNLNDAAGDADSDGLTNIQEYQNGTDPNDPDTDNDGMDDDWEVTHDLNPLVDDSSGDADTDGLTNLQEYNRGTNPQDPDTDNDGISDGDEVANGTDPLDPDSDSDGMPNSWEIDNGLDPQVDDASDDEDSDGLTNLEEYQNDTDPNDADTDNDQMSDYWEVANSLDPLADDAGDDEDSDGLTNLNEYNIGTNPNSEDSDSDTMPDLWEVNNGLDPTLSNASSDADSDGLTNVQEYNAGTDPKNSDTDSDGLPDGWEVTYSPPLSPTNAIGNAGADGDPDGDQADNLWEYQQGTDPTVADNVYQDTDGDGMPDIWEDLHGLDKDNAADALVDSDSDGLTNFWEHASSTVPTNTDTDADGLTDGQEVNEFDSNPVNSNDPVFVDDNGPYDWVPFDPEYSDTNENGRIDHPFDALQEAVNLATNGMTVLVTNGLYEGIGNWGLTLGGKDITIRSWNGSAFTTIRTHGYGSAFVLNNSETTNTVIQGFTIETQGDLSPEEGIVVDGSSPVIRDCLIHNCELEAISCLNGAAPRIIDCEFYDVPFGVYAVESEGVLIQNCYIHETYIFSDGADMYGRGLYISDDDKAEITWTTVSNCPGGGITLNSSDAEIRQCIIQNNNTPNYITVGSYVVARYGFRDLNNEDETELTVSDENGAGILLSGDSSPLIRNCLIVGNKTWAEDPAYAENAVEPAYGLGGGIYIGPECNPTGVNCTVADNHAMTRGGSVSSAGRPVFRNMIFWGNTSSNAAVYADPVSRSVVSLPAFNNIYIDDQVIDIWYCDIEFGYSNAVLCITNDPQFVEGGGTNHYFLASGSPCTNAGTYYLASQVDLLGNLRPQVEDFPKRVDMGCYQISGGLGAATNPIVAGFSVEPEAVKGMDTDGDGFDDVSEMVLGTDLYNTADHFQVSQSQTQVEGTPLISWKSAKDCFYTVQTTADLMSGSWSNMTGYTELPGTGGTMSFTNTPSGPARYYRIRVRLP